MIRITFKRQSDRAVAEAIRSKAPQLRQALTEEMDKLMLDLVARVQQKLSGEVLEHRTGILSGSITKQPTVQSGNRIIGTVTGAGPPAQYGIVQEMGGRRAFEILPVHKRALAFFPSGAAGAGPEGRSLFHQAGRLRGSLKRGKGAEFSALGGVVVKRVIHPPLPPRPFMSTSLNEMRGEIVSRIFEAAAKAIE